MLATLAAILAVLLALAAIPHRGRAAARAALSGFAVVLPILLLVHAISRWPRASFGSYLALVPVIVTWACVVDARHGLSHRLARIGPRRDRPDQVASE